MLNVIKQILSERQGQLSCPTDKAGWVLVVNSSRRTAVVLTGHGLDALKCIKAQVAATGGKRWLCRPITAGIEINKH